MRDGLPSFLDGSSRCTRLEDRGGSAKHVGGCGVVAMVGMLVIAGEGCVFGVLEVAVRPTVGDVRAKVGATSGGRACDSRRRDSDSRRSDSFLWLD